MATVLFIHPVHSGGGARPSHRTAPAPGLAPHLLAECCVAAGHRALVIDELWMDSRGAEPSDAESWIRECDAVIDSFGIDVVGVTMLTHFRSLAYRLVTEIRKRHPGLSIIAGGPHPTHLARGVLDRLSDALSGVFSGEADEVIGEIVGRLAEGAVPDVPGYYPQGRRLEAPLAVQEARIEHIRTPSYCCYPEPVRSLSRVNVVTSRGCPTPTCSFCSITTGGARFRVRPLSAVRAEISSAVERGAQSVEFHDSVFALSPQRLRELFGGLDLGGIRDFYCHTRPNDISPAVLDALSETGRRWRVFLGLETASQSLRASIGKTPFGADGLNGLKANIVLARRLGISIGVFLIVGLDGERPADIQGTLDFLCDAEVDEVFATVLKYLPGSRVYADAIRRGAVREADLVDPEGPFAYYVPSGDRLLQALDAVAMFNERFDRGRDHNRVEAELIARLSASAGEASDGRAGGTR